MQNVLVGGRSRAETFLKANLEQRPGPWGELHKLKLPEDWRVTIAIENSDRFNDVARIIPLRNVQLLRGVQTFSEANLDKSRGPWGVA